VQEHQACTVLRVIDAARSAYSDRQEDDGVRSIRVYLMIIPHFILTDLFRAPSDRGEPGEDTLCETVLCDLLTFKSFLLVQGTRLYSLICNLVDTCGLFRCT
jgi:hypothetical protein